MNIRLKSEEERETSSGRTEPKNAEDEKFEPLKVSFC